jgi:RNA polymerase sigma-70 factor (ECF subfamily)
MTAADIIAALALAVWAYLILLHGGFWLARERYEPRAPFTCYQYTIAKNLWLHERERRNHRPPPVSLEEGLSPLAREAAFRALAAEPTLPEQVLFANERLFRIRQAIAKLPAEQRLVFTLSHLEGLRYAEIAEVLGVPLGTVKSRMNAAITKLRGHLRILEEE